MEQLGRSSLSSNNNACTNFTLIRNKQKNCVMQFSATLIMKKEGRRISHLIFLHHSKVEEYIIKIMAPGNQQHSYKSYAIIKTLNNFSGWPKYLWRYILVPFLGKKKHLVKKDQIIQWKNIGHFFDFCLSFDDTKVTSMFYFSVFLLSDGFQRTQIPSSILVRSSYIRW